MEKRFLSLFMVLLLTGLAQQSFAGQIDLSNWAFKIDAVTSESASGDSMPGLPSLSNGLGTVSITVTGVGDHYVGAFFDYEIDEDNTNFFNEYGFTSGTLATGQSWEIDEPGYVSGDIYTNTLHGSLDNSNTVPSGSENDVSMALGWDFILDAGETASITFLLSTTAPSDGFFLGHHDPDTAGLNTVYLSSSMEIEERTVPEPAAILLFGMGLLGLAGVSRKE